MSKFAFFKRLFGGAEAEQERREKPRERSREGTRILVIDDSLTILAVMRKMLTQNNFVTL